jgi:hypothetical protein
MESAKHELRYLLENGVEAVPGLRLEALCVPGTTYHHSGDTELARLVHRDAVTVAQRHVGLRAAAAG